MEIFVQHLRVRFSGIGREVQDEGQNIRIPSQRSTSFQRGQMSALEEYDAAYAATVAAAAYAIAAREEERSRRPLEISRAPVETTGAALTRTKSKKEESLKKPPGGSKILRWFSAKEPTEEDEATANVSVRRPLPQAQKKLEDTAADQKMMPKRTETSPSMKRTPTFSDRSRDDKGSKRFEQAQASRKPSPPPSRPASSVSGKGHGGPKLATGSDEVETKAEEWEKEKLARIKEEYEKMMATISEWENEKKVKAKLQKDRQETELDRRRAKVLMEFNEEMARINKIVGGARAMAEEKKKKDEIKAREKAQKIRTTGKVPKSCACF